MEDAGHIKYGYDLSSYYIIDYMLGAPAPLYIDFLLISLPARYLSRITRLQIKVNILIINTSPPSRVSFHKASSSILFGAASVIVHQVRASTILLFRMGPLFHGPLCPAH